MLAGLVVVRVAPFFVVPPLPKRLCAAASTWMTDVATLVHLHELVMQVLRICSLEAHVDGFTNCVPILDHEQWPPSAGSHSGGVDEGALLSCSSPVRPHPLPGWSRMEKFIC